MILSTSPSSAKRKRSPVGQPVYLQTLNESLSILWSSSFPHPQPRGVSTIMQRQFGGRSRILVCRGQGANQNNEGIKKFIRKCIALAFVPIRFVRIAWQGLKAGQPAIPRMDEFISYMEDTWIAECFPSTCGMSTRPQDHALTTTRRLAQLPKQDCWEAISSSKKRSVLT